MKDFVTQFKQGAWMRMARRFVGDKTKLAALAMEAVRYARSKESLADVKSDLLLFCHYVRDIATGRYKGYRVWHLTVVVAALIYVVSPIDIIPDFLLGGFIDDVGIIAWAFSQVGKELEAYKETMSPDSLTEEDFDDF